MKPTDFVSKGEKLVTADDPALRYTGRIDFDDPGAPVLVYPYSSVEMRFSGTSLKVILKNQSAYSNNYIGCIIDGEQRKTMIPEHGKMLCLPLAEGLENREHDLFFFKRMDSCHEFNFYGFVADENAAVMPPREKRPARRIEVYGDSVSAGEVSEAVEYAGKADPPNNGEYSNSYYSYTAITARKLRAELHDVAQGGIALLHGTGWYDGPDYIGMEEMWDDIEYHTAFGFRKKWDFSKYTPHVVLVALGQNDSSPEDYMAKDYGSARSEFWRCRYERFLRKIRSIYPDALVIAATTILSHSPEWDRAIGEVCARIDDPKIVHFLYSLNGRGTPGHIRIPEADRMSDELSRFIQSFGDSVWQSQGG